MSNKLEEMLLRLYDNDQFYARLFFMVSRQQTKKELCPTMGVTIEDSKLKLYYNKEYLDSISTRAAMEILKHEALHFVNKHIIRSEGMKNQDMMQAKMENIAMDCAINQFLDKDIIDEIGGITLENFGQMVNNTNLLEKMPYEYYLDALQKEKERREKDDQQNGGDSLGEFEQQLSDKQMDDHSNFKPMDALDQAMLEDKIRKAAEETRANGAGNLPSEIEELLKLMGKAKVNWKREMRIFVGDKIRSDRRSTRSKRNRRYGITFAGHKKDYKAKILVAIDTSGSMSNTDIETCLNEVYGIYQTTPNLQLDIVECDAQIQEVFTYTGEKDFKISGRGGTDFQPALDHAKKHKYDGLVFLTDGGYWEKPKNTGVPVIWGIVGGYSFDIDFGKTIKIDLNENDRGW